VSFTGNIVSPNCDYPAFWRSMMRLAHELAENNVGVVHFAVMLPEQVLANSDIVNDFDSVHFLCLTCPPDILHARLAARDGSDEANAISTSGCFQRCPVSGGERCTSSHSRRCPVARWTRSKTMLAIGSPPA
jgi:hypothetical protein